jgi:hypothetical protein
MDYTPANEPDACIKLLDDWIISTKKDLHEKYVLNSKGTEEGDVIYEKKLKDIGKKLNAYIDSGDRDSIKDYNLPEEICKCVLDVVGASIVFQDRITAWCIEFPAIRTKEHLDVEIKVTKTDE